MAIIPTEGRNIVNFARKIIGEKLVFERRGWDNMIANKSHTDVKMLGQEMLENYRLLMINITSVDLLSTDIATLDSAVIREANESTANLIDALTRYLLLEFSMDDMTELLNAVASSIAQWNLSVDGAVLVTKGETYERVKNPDELKEGIENLSAALSNDLAYLTLILLADLHHLTYVASADQCLEILSST